MDPEESRPSISETKSRTRHLLQLVDAPIVDTTYGLCWMEPSPGR